jgi:predicted nucleic acid-binding protein
MRPWKTRLVEPRVVSSTTRFCRWEGEREAITLALAMRTDLILIDERKGTHVALNKAFEVAGTLGVLALAARLGWSISRMLSRGLRERTFATVKRSWMHSLIRLCAESACDVARIRRVNYNP